MDPEFRALIKRHVVQADAHNRYLEKKRMWREYEEELAREDKKQDNREEPQDADRNENLQLLSGGDREGLCLRRNYRDRTHSQGIFAGENAQHSDASGGRFCSDTSKEGGRRMRKRSVVPSFDVHAADRVVTASEKQRRLLRSATAAVGDTWLPDKYYTHELQQEHPWVNPTEVLSRYIACRQKCSDDELTPKASTSVESSDVDTESGSRLKDTRWKLKQKKKCSRVKKKKKKRKTATVQGN